MGMYMSAQKLRVPGVTDNELPGMDTGAGLGTSRRAAQLLTTEPSLELLPSLHGFQRLILGC